MAEATTSIYHFVKPDIGGSKETWGNRLNKDLDDIDEQVALQNSSQWSGLQNGLNTKVVKDYDSTGNVVGTLPLTDLRFRTAGNILTYTDAMVDTIGVDTTFFDPKKLGTLVPQKLLFRMLDLLMPVGTIVIWSGSAANIPAGWHLCDNVGHVLIEGGGTAEMTIPDLRGRFILGAYPDGSSKPKMMPSDPISGTNGVFGHLHLNVVLGHTLTPDELAPHRHGTPASGNYHTFLVQTNAGGGPAYIGGPPAGQSGNSAYHYMLGTGGGLFPDAPGGIDGITAEHTHPISNVNNTTPDSPWYALCYIIKIRKWETFY